MKRVYLQIWRRAKPYYQKGRPMDINHIRWMMKQAKFVSEKENLDDSLLIPLVILHDVGYSDINDIKSIDYHKKDIRKIHMVSGKKIACGILKELKYPKNKISKILYYISVHDNWALGEVDIYLKDDILGNFKDLDYIWSYTKEGFDSVRKILKISKAEMLKRLKIETSPIYGKKPFSSQTTKRLYDKYLLERMKSSKTLPFSTP